MEALLQPPTMKGFVTTPQFKFYPVPKLIQSIQQFHFQFDLKMPFAI
uniref:Uncharacterized protein n=1 Tax=Shewanella putrefaciens (strain 200) TaxID=399804 RepID=E6XSE8_SHEP2